MTYNVSLCHIILLTAALTGLTSHTPDWIDVAQAPSISKRRTLLTGLTSLKLRPSIRYRGSAVRSQKTQSKQRTRYLLLFCPRPAL